MALYSLYSAEVPLRNCSLTHSGGGMSQILYPCLGEICQLIRIGLSKKIITSAEEGGYVFILVCLFVCLPVG